MTELNTTKPALIVSSDSRPLSETGRLILVVPPGEVDLNALTARIWELAKAAGARVSLLGLYDHPAQELELRRRLATMSAMVNSSEVRADAEVVRGNDWVTAVRSRLRSGDMVVCCAEPGGGSMAKPMRQILESNLDAPVTILSGLTPEEKAPSKWGAQILAWAGSLGILVGFFWLQIRMDQMPKDIGRTLLLLLTIPVEVWLIWIWNSLFS